MTRKIRVRRRGFIAHRHKKRWKIRRGNKIITAHARKDSWRVSPATYLTKDRGAPGRGKKVIKKLKKGEMTRWAIKLGYIKEGQRVSDIPYSKIDDFAIDLAKRVGARRAWGMFRVQVLFRKRERNGFKKKMQRAADAIAEKFPEALTPKEAVRTWKNMSPRERAKRMPGGKV